MKKKKKSKKADNLETSAENTSSPSNEPNEKCEPKSNNTPISASLSKPKRKIATKLESARRVHQIYQYLAEGWSNVRIYRKAAELYNISPRQTEHYISKARQILSKKLLYRQTEHLSDILSKMDAIHRKTFEEGEVKVTEKGDEYVVHDYSVARQALMDKAKLLGLLKEKVEMTVNDLNASDADISTLESVASDQNESVH